MPLSSEISHGVFFSVDRTTCTSLSELKSIRYFNFELCHRVGFLIQLCQHSNETTKPLMEVYGKRRL